MMEFINWISADKNHFIGTIAFIGLVCWFITWPISAIRGNKPDDLD